MKDTTGLETSTKIYVISHLQPGIHKNSEGPRYFDSLHLPLFPL